MHHSVLPVSSRWWTFWWSYWRAIQWRRTSSLASYWLLHSGFAYYNGGHSIWGRTLQSSRRWLLRRGRGSCVVLVSQLCRGWRPYTISEWAEVLSWSEASRPRWGTSFKLTPVLSWFQNSISSPVMDPTPSCTGIKRLEGSCVTIIDFSIWEVPSNSILGPSLWVMWPLEDILSWFLIHIKGYGPLRCLTTFADCWKGRPMGANTVGFQVARIWGGAADRVVSKPVWVPGITEGRTLPSKLEASCWFRFLNTLQSLYKWLTEGGSG